MVVVDGAGTGEAGEAGVLERSVEKESRGNTKGSAAALSLGVNRAFPFRSACRFLRAAIDAALFENVKACIDAW